MSNYNEVRYSIYNRLDGLIESERDEIVRRLGWLERIIEQRERNKIIFLLHQGIGANDLANYLEALNEDAERQEQEYGPG